MLQHQLAVHVFVQSIQVRDFQLYVQALTKPAHWFFALDHFNYARWISVHLRDIMILSRLHPLIFAEFHKGHFTDEKASHAFSKIAMDHGGAVGLTESPAALQRWVLCEPAIARLINNFQTSVDYAQNTPDVRHQAKWTWVEKVFLQDVNSLIMNNSLILIHSLKLLVICLFWTHEK